MPSPTIRLIALAAVALTQSGCADILGFGGDDDPPALEAVLPADGATGISVLDGLTLRFTTAIELSTAAAGVRLEADGRALMVEASLVDGRTLLVTPTDPLDFGTEYRVVVTSELTSRSGEPLVTPETSTFTTRGLPPPAPDPDSLLRHLEALAHDSMRGRGSGSDDELKAARYLEDRFRAYGLHTPPGGAMIQPFEAFAPRRDSVLSSRNVMAAVPGSGALAHEWIVVGGHYDHIGFRDLDTDSLGPNNGADDNASGTVLVLELARILQAYLDEDGMAGTGHRSVLFMGFGAEEEGLLGSCHYVFTGPVVPLSQTRAMMNFDMVGRLRDDVVVVSGQETAEAWPPMVANANAPGLFSFRPQASRMGGTDHTCFWQAGIPWVGFFTDFHPEYHGPEDDVALINVPGMGRIGDLAFRILARLMVTPVAPEFLPPGAALGPGPTR